MDYEAYITVQGDVEMEAWCMKMRFIPHEKE